MSTAADRAARTPDSLAQLFHETYERLAPEYSYKTREASAVPWVDVPDNNKRLMVAVAGEVLAALDEPAEPTFDQVIHAGGRCTCSGEGRCDWCKRVEPIEPGAFSIQVPAEGVGELLDFLFECAGGTAMNPPNKKVAAVWEKTVKELLATADALREREGGK